ncbi:transcription antitermination factor NusB [Agitococcus lubricus]|uniref:Transcription antitermination protein NusB n=1 Tax=Agitococcus lubricus TaxID=1077255 RepID=A0A2T5IUJ1_9GAMM|nr:transcription antitermination factor NusB [Agitococcus lubricus]PTQ87538.1 NusB antitermination factor [Agitococcus lubricus]
MQKAQAKNTPAARHKARKFALQGLYEWQLSGNPPFEIEARYRVENAMHKVDLAYFHELLHQVVGRVHELDPVFEPLLDRKLQQLDPIERNIIRMGCYELKHHIEIPYRVVLNEAVELAKEFGATDSYKFVNSILDEVAKSVRSVERQAE